MPDVRVGEWPMPWNARDGVGRLGPGIPESNFWASAKEGTDQVGCVYTAQGFEFDYVGMIVGPDLEGHQGDPAGGEPERRLRGLPRSAPPRPRARPRLLRKLPLTFGSHLLPRCTRSRVDARTMFLCPMELRGSPDRLVAWHRYGTHALMGRLDT